jgi:hypothetical protein
VQLEIIQAPDLVRAEARMPRWMIAIALVGAVATLLTGHWRVAAGVAVGAALGIMNYLWLHQAIVALLNAEQAGVPKTVVAKMLVRYPLLLAGMFWFCKTGWLPISAIMGGLLVPGAGVLVESLCLIRAGLRDDEVVG